MGRDATPALFIPIRGAGILFFALVLGSGPLTPTLAAMGFTPLMAAVLVGAAQNVFSKSSKYSLFDPCKEMAYIPLDQETQVKLVTKVKPILEKQPMPWHCTYVQCHIRFS